MGEDRADDLCGLTFRPHAVDFRVRFRGSRRGALGAACVGREGLLRPRPWQRKGLLNLELGLLSCSSS